MIIRQMIEENRGFECKHNVCSLSAMGPMNMHTDYYLSNWSHYSQRLGQYDRLYGAVRQAGRPSILSGLYLMHC